MPEDAQDFDSHRARGVSPGEVLLQPRIEVTQDFAVAEGGAIAECPQGEEQEVGIGLIREDFADKIADREGIVPQSVQAIHPAADFGGRGKAAGHVRTLPPRGGGWRCRERRGRARLRR